MKDITKIILGFLVFAVAAGAVLGFGLYRKRDAVERRRLLTTRADNLCQTSARDFASQSRGERENLLEEAGRLKTGLESDRDADRRHAEALNDWVTAQALLHEQLNRLEKSLQGLQDSLKEEFPAEPARQLAQDVAARLQKALSAAESFCRDAGVRIGPRQVKLSELCGGVREVQAQAGRVRDQLGSREAAYAEFLQEVTASLADKDRQILSQEDVKTSMDDLDAWLRHASDCQDKMAKLESLKGQFASLASSLKQEKELAEKLQEAARALAGSSSDSESGKSQARQDAEAVLSDAKGHGGRRLQPLIEKAQRLLSQADTEGRKMAEKLDLAKGLIRAINAYLAARSGGSPAGASADDDIRRSIESLNSLSSQYGGFFDRAFRDLLTSSDPDKTRALSEQIIQQLSTEGSPSDEIEGNIQALEKEDRELAGFFRKRVEEKKPAPARTPGSASMDWRALITTANTLRDNAQYLKRVADAATSVSALRTALSGMVSALDAYLKTLGSQTGRLPSTENVPRRGTFE